MVVRLQLCLRQGLGQFLMAEVLPWAVLKLPASRSWPGWVVGS